MKNIFSTLVLEQNPSYVEELEKKHSIELPPIFKAFVQTFEFGKFNPTPQHEIIHPNNELGFDGFEHTLEEKINIYNNTGDYYQEQGLLPIIPSGIYAGGICLGISDEIKDKIFLYVDGLNEKLRLISPDILQFIKQLKDVHWDTI